MFLCRTITTLDLDIFLTMLGMSLDSTMVVFALVNPDLGSLVISPSSFFMPYIHEQNALVFLGWIQLAFKTIKNYLIA